MTPVMIPNELTGATLTGLAYTSEQDQGEDGDTERGGGADREGQVRPIGERLPGCPEQRLPEPDLGRIAYQR